MLRVYTKAWKDYMIYNRHLMQSNMAAIQFSRSNQQYLMQAVFDALRNHKESRKHVLLVHAVENDVKVAIANASLFNQNQAEVILRKNKARAGNIVIAMMGKRLFAYFMHWHAMTEDYKTKMNTKVKDKIIRQYIKYMKSYFSQWRKNMDSKST